LTSVEALARLDVAPAVIEGHEIVPRPMSSRGGIWHGLSRGSGGTDARTVPCTYWTQSPSTITDLEVLGEHVIETQESQPVRAIARACQGCPCQGRCVGRRALLDGLEQLDPFCPFARGDTITMAWEKAGAQDLPKAGSACTTVVSARSSRGRFDQLGMQTPSIDSVSYGRK
jgi:hypothetical protein